MSKKQPRDTGHINALHQEKARLERMTHVGLKRIEASFPDIRGLIDKLGWLIEITDPTAGRNMNPRVTTSSTNDGISQASASVARFRKVQDYVRIELRDLNKDLADKIEATEHDRCREESPRCWRRGCVDENGEPTRGRRQGFDNEVCQWCGEPFSRGQTA